MDAKHTRLELDNHMRYLRCGVCNNGEIALSVSDAGSQSAWIHLTKEQASKLLLWLEDATKTEAKATQ